MSQTPNLLSSHGAAIVIGRDRNKVQIQIVCGTEAEAKAILEGFKEQIRTTGRAQMYFGGTLDEMASAGKKN